MPPPEQQARQQIDALLLEAGWIIQNLRELNLAGKGVALREVPLKSGRCDYLLLVNRKPVGVVEAKKVGTRLSNVAERSRHYGENLPDFLATDGVLPFCYESTGAETFFRDERDPHPRSRSVFAFHRPETLMELLEKSDTLRYRLARLSFAYPLVTHGMRDFFCLLPALPHYLPPTSVVGPIIRPGIGTLVVVRPAVTVTASVSVAAVASVVSDDNRWQRQIQTRTPVVVRLTVAVVVRLSVAVAVVAVSNAAANERCYQDCKCDLHNRSYHGYALGDHHGYALGDHHYAGAVIPEPGLSLFIAELLQLIVELPTDLVDAVAEEL